MKNHWLYPPLHENHQVKQLHLNIGIRISKFKNYGKLKKSLLCYIASQLSEQEIGDLRDIFLHLADKNGRISFDQFEKAFENTKFMHKDSGNLKTIFEGIDVNHKGTIDYTGKINIEFYLYFSNILEFLAAAIPEDIFLKEEKINSAFLVFDRTKTGKVSKNELKNTLGSQYI